MANWISLKSAAEKYGISEEQFREWTRLKYLRYSSIDKEPYEDSNPMLDTEEIDKALEFNTMESYPDDENMERISKVHIHFLYSEIARLEELNDKLEKVSNLQSEQINLLKGYNEKLMNMINESLFCNKGAINDCKDILNQDNKVWHFLSHLFKTKHYKVLI